jgi:hypothetical protein
MLACSASMTPLADAIWNRAVLDGGGIAPRSGDRALSAMMLLHGRVMNGGVLHAIDCLSPDELRAAMDAYLLFSLPAVVELLNRAIEVRERGSEPELDEAESRLDAEYAVAVENDEALCLHFEQHLQLHPELFGPVAMT